MRRTLIALGTILVLLGGIAAAAAAPASAVCGPLDSGRIEVPGDAGSVTVTAPEGTLIDAYCVKAGSSNQEYGPEYVTVDPPQQTVTIAHPSGKDISHWSVSYTENPTTSTSQPPSTTTTTGHPVTTTTQPPMLTTSTVSPETTTTGGTTATTLPLSSTTTGPPATTTTSSQPPLGTSITKPPTTLPETGVPFEQLRGIGITGGALLSAGLAMLAAATFVGNRRVAAIVPGAIQEILVPVSPRPSFTIYVELHRIPGTG